MADHSKSATNMLIVGVVLGLAAGGMGGYCMTSCKVDKPATELNAAGAKLDALVGESGQLMNALSKSHTVTDVAPEGVTVNGKPRFTPIFYSPELWQVAIDAQKKNVVMDLHDASSPNIHGDVPNAWFIANGLMDAMGRSDALTVDTDGDGFNNLEEYTAKTSPTDPKSFPALIAPGRPPKMEAVKVVRDKFVIQVDSSFAYDSAPNEVTIKLFRTREDAKPFDTKKGLKVGESFGVDKDNNRFTITGFVSENYSDSAGSASKENAVKIRDNVTVGGEKEFTVRAGSVRSNPKDRGTRNEKGHQVNDVAAVLRMTAGPKAGTPEGTITVAEHATFKVPGAEDITCTLESIDAAGSVNILPAGAQSPINVPAAAAQGAK